MKIWDTQIGNATEIAASMPKWYARTTVIDLKRATLEDGSIDFSKASAQYQVGDVLMFIPCNDFDKALVDNKGAQFTVTEVTPDMHYKFAEKPASEGVFFVVKFMYNEHFEASDKFAMVPVTIEMIENDRKTEDKKLRNLGLKQPGWYKWRMVDRSSSKRSPMISAELSVSIKRFHSPDGTSSDAGETFQPVPGAGVEEGQLIFDPVDGSITLG